MGPSARHKEIKPAGHTSPAGLRTSQPQLLAGVQAQQPDHGGLQQDHRSLRSPGGSAAIPLAAAAVGVKVCLAQLPWGQDLLTHYPKLWWRISHCCQCSHTRPPCLVYRPGLLSMLRGQASSWQLLPASILLSCYCCSLGTRSLTAPEGVCLGLKSFIRSAIDPPCA